MSYVKRDMIFSCLEFHRTGAYSLMRPELSFDIKSIKVRLVNINVGFYWYLVIRFCIAYSFRRSSFEIYVRRFLSIFRC